jgi:hypothetical protein
MLDEDTKTMREEMEKMKKVYLTSSYRAFYDIGKKVISEWRIAGMDDFHSSLYFIVS